MFMDMSSFALCFTGSFLFCQFHILNSWNQCCCSFDVMELNSVNGVLKININSLKIVQLLLGKKRNFCFCLSRGKRAKMFRKSCDG